MAVWSSKQSLVGTADPFQSTAGAKNLTSRVQFFSELNMKCLFSLTMYYLLRHGRPAFPRAQNCGCYWRLSQRMAIISNAECFLGNLVGTLWYVRLPICNRSRTNSLEKELFSFILIIFKMSLTTCHLTVIENCYNAIWTSLWTSPNSEQIVNFFGFQRVLMLIG